VEIAIMGNATNYPIDTIATLAWHVVGVKAVGDAVTLEEVFELMRARRSAVSYDADRRELGWACRLSPRR
jgi:hypothetical protein